MICEMNHNSTSKIMIFHIQKNYYIVDSKNDCIVHPTIIALYIMKNFKLFSNIWHKLFCLWQHFLNYYHWLF